VQGTYGLAQLGTNGNQDFPDGLNYYTDNWSNHGAGEPGQTFTTGTNVGGCVLASLAIRTAGLGSYSGINTPQPYYLHVYSVSGSVGTLLQTYTSANVTFADGDWLQWTGLSLPLSANATYMWSFGKASSTSGWEAMAVATNNLYAGGEMALVLPTTGAVTFGSSHGFDAVFNVGLIPSTTPAIRPVTVSPTNYVSTGTPVTFTASVTGATPLHFQWQFDSGSGFADMADANTNWLALTTAITNAGSYQLVVTNIYGAVTSAPITLTVNLDTNPPVVLGVFNFGTTNVELDFSKLLEAASATNMANYIFSNGHAITSASLAANGRTVWLGIAPLTYGSNYTLIINGVRDQAIPPNTIASNTLVNFTTSPRQRISLDVGWKFQLGDPVDVTTDVTYYPEIPNLAKLDSTEVAGTNSDTYYETNRVDIFATHAGENVSFVRTNYNDSAWRSLDLPHDWAVELPFNSSADAGHGFKPVGNSSFGANNFGWYRRTFTMPESLAGQSLWLEFDGVYRNCLIWLNGHIIGRNVSGYSSFYFDVTPYANTGGTNVLVVRVDASRFEGWFYEGAGIYRHVWLTTENPVHVAEWGTFAATTSLIGSNATVTIQTDVTNQSGVATSSGNLTSTVLDANSNVVASVTSALNIPGGQDLVVTQTVSFAANLWSLQTPYLYKLVTTVSNQNTIADIYNTPFGVRIISIDSTNGVFINGRRVAIQGMCNHQDMAGVGSALPDRLQYFRIERLKEMGVNAYRSSHNEPTAELLDACDQLGMLVLDENRRLGTNAEPLSELSRQIRRDRNHPSVFMWSLCNEETLQGTTTGASIIQVMQNLVHSMDSTRKCTAAMSGGWGSGFSPVLDVMGFNYNLGGIDGFHSSYPTQSCIGTETSSEVGTRGVYTNDTSAGFVTAYDNNAVGWGETAEAWWQFYLARPWSSGGFCWTGFDYRGEPTPYGWPCINSHFGVMDMCGFPKDIFYYYQANWTLKPVLHLFPHWNWSTPGQPINVWAFGNCQTVELFTNGVSLGRQTFNLQGHVEWDNVPYAPGTLQAIGYNYGVPVITNTVVTTGQPAAIVLTPDRDTILADGRDVSIVTVSVVDARGDVVPTATNEIYFSVSGSGAILGVGNGNPSSHEADKASQRAVFNGLAQVIVQSAVQPGSITLTTTSPGLDPTNVMITAASSLPPPAAPTGVVAIGGNAQVTVSWDIVPGAITYNLWRSTASDGPYSLIAGNIGGVNLGWLDNAVTNGTTYFYIVTANGNGTSPNSAEASATPFAVVTNVLATANSGKIAVTWAGTPGAFYNLKRAYVSGGPYTTIASSLATTNYADTNVATCQTYYYVVTITNVGNESFNSPEAVAEVPGALPPQFASADIGPAGLAGNVSFCDGQFAISGSGADIWGTNDAFRFVYAYVPVSTNCDIRARVGSIQNTSGNAKAAVMIRETLDSNSRHALVDVEPSAGIEFLYRTTTGGASSAFVVAGQTAPNWVRLTRTNNTFTAYWSPDGTFWNQIGSPADIPMTGTSGYVGLAVCAHNNSVLNTSLIDHLAASFLTNVPPVISWVTPTNDQSVYRANILFLTATATDPDGSVTNVSFFNGASLLGRASVGYASQFSLAWSNAPAGNYQLAAIAIDDSGVTNTIPAAISVSVVSPPPFLLQAGSGALENGRFNLTFQGLANQTYVLQASTNLVDWTPMQTNSTSAEGLVECSDMTATNTARFYRVVQNY
jgi:beta-galactosidase